MSQEQKAPLFTLDRSTLVPIGLLVSVVLASITATTWLHGTLLKLDHKIEQLNQRVGLLTDGVRDRWTGGDMRTWAELLAARNPTLSVPAVSELKK